MRFQRRHLSLLFVTFAMFMAMEQAKAQKNCETQTEGSSSFTVCTFDASTSDPQLYWKKDNGQPIVSMAFLARHLEKSGKNLVFAIGTSPTHVDLTPVGLHIEKGQTLNPLNKDQGEGNFFTKPNGVFYFGEGQAGILTTARFDQVKPRALYATQSGPMLVINGQVNPTFQNWTSQKMRSAVGIRDGVKTPVFVISQNPVTFKEQATFLRNRLKVSDALTIVGSAYIPEIKANDLWIPVGPMIGIAQ